MTTHTILSEIALGLPSPSQRGKGVLEGLFPPLPHPPTLRTLETVTETSARAEDMCSATRAEAYTARPRRKSTQFQSVGITNKLLVLQGARLTPFL